MIANGIPTENTEIAAKRQLQLVILWRLFKQKVMTSCSFMFDHTKLLGA